MKFKKEDAGLYFAFILIGGGIGLLTGAIIASYLEKMKKNKEMEEGAVEVADDSWAEKERARIDEELAQRREHAEMMAGRYRKEEWTVKPAEKKDKVRKRNEKNPNNSGFSEEELDSFAAEFGANEFQMQMIRLGTMTMDQVRGVIEEERLAEESDPTDYSAPYRTYFENAKEDAENGELPDPREIEELGLIDDRWRVTLEAPNHSNELSLKELQWEQHALQWDDEDNEFYYLRQGRIIPYDIRTSFGHDVWEHVVRYILGDDVNELYIEDLQNGRLFLIHKLVAMGEDEPLTPEDYVAD